MLDLTVISFEVISRRRVTHGYHGELLLRVGAIVGTMEGDDNEGVHPRTGYEGPENIIANNIIFPFYQRHRSMPNSCFNAAQTVRCKYCLESSWNSKSLFAGRLPAHRQPADLTISRTRMPCATIEKPHPGGAR